MKYEITVEQLKPARKSAPARWRKVGRGTFKDIEEAHRWAERIGMPKEPAVGWAVRIAWLP